MSDTVTFQPGPLPHGLAPVPAFEVPRQVPGTVHGFGSTRFGIEGAPTTGPVYLGAYQPSTATGTDGMAIASFVLSLLGLSLLGVVLGHLALRRTAASGRSGRGFAVAGLVIGYFLITVSLALVGFGALGGLASGLGLGLG